MKKIVTKREADDIHHAELIAQGMENAGANVFSVTQFSQGVIAVYCTHDPELSLNAIDAEIKKVVEKRGAVYQAA